MGYQKPMRPAPPANQASEPDSRAQSLIGSYERGGYRRVEPAILQPAEPFLDLSGEDIRQRITRTGDIGTTA